MSDYKWCHGPSCHKSHTQDRIRGSKGSKVLRTRKIKQWETDSIYSYFCSQHCYNEFANKYAQQVIRIAPRNEPLETPIEDPKKTKYTGSYVYADGTRQTWTETEIKERVDTSME